ncbi:alcohol dehydrogenase GroES-like domain-containing protein [Colletotrichum limetticola]|uniref:Alcohol dehydrogenase GroES-like domain-containing protein n=1 Tax=Colletotrichum limetticola TaxID=1209924 RepID=A0ABQ9PEL4_9PEZI|nr:alcohol dehydrogenase GroES-like domain-containing protein [Colletotrichum limetticola]
MSLSFLNSTMRAAVMTGPYQVHIDQFPVPRIINTTGAVVRFTTSALCGPDLHRYHGYMGGEPPCALRHEAMGYIEFIGSDASHLAVGQYVVIPDNGATGHIDMGVATGPRMGLAFGGLNGGLQAPYARVPFADMALIPVPLTAETTNTSIEQDYLTVSDASDPVQQILAYKPGGVIRAADAVGMEAITANGTMQQNIVLNQMVELVAAVGGIGQIGIYLAQPNTGLAPNAERIMPEVSFPSPSSF